MKRVLMLLLVAIVGIILFYLSRFWFLNLWPRDGLFGLEELRPRGGLVGQWLRGTKFAPFELLIWITGVFLLLTYLQKFIDFLLPEKTLEEDEHHDH